VRVFFDAYLKRDAGSLRTLRQDASPIAGAAWTHRDALPAPPMPAQFDEIIGTRGPATAAALFHALRAADSAVVVFTERQLPRYATLWGPERSRDLLGRLEGAR
jgi:hypothetical protein